jgi:hypothetical protein
MSSHIVIIVLEQIINGINRYVYQAFSSSNPERSAKNLLKDVFYTIGYQNDTQTDNIYTLRGTITKESFATSSTTLEERSQGIRCVMKSTGEVHPQYPIKGINQPYSSTIPQAAGTVTTMLHEVIEPFSFYVSDGEETESDSDSE